MGKIYENEKIMLIRLIEIVSSSSIYELQKIVLPQIKRRHQYRTIESKEDINT